ncbi:class I SAM-dependent methyltransferase [Brevundimonas sp.]|uniref:class I SAM-dependent methyltransferase n=1 Tax=Brevundimonas sp. TaxID=1871086 RepID=UPI003AF7F2DD
MDKAAPHRTDDGIYEPAFVKGVFDRCSGTYISMSWFFSAGFTERWRRQCVEALPLSSRQSVEGYDLMAGTGEVWPHLFRRHPGITRVTAVDISSGMHQLALKRLHRDRSHRISFVEDDVLRSDLPPGSCDFIVSTFGLKTFNPDQHRALAEVIARTLRPGGAFSLIEASDPRGWWLRPLYLFHLKVLLPLVERTLLRGAQDFAMIGTYTSNFGDARSFADMLRAQGLEVRFQRYFFGCATGVSGRKPEAAKADR